MGRWGLATLCLLYDGAARRTGEGSWGLPLLTQCRLSFRGSNRVLGDISCQGCHHLACHRAHQLLGCVAAPPCSLWGWTLFPTPAQKGSNPLAGNCTTKAHLGTQHAPC